MATIKRVRRTPSTKPLTLAFDAGEPPPDWAYEPGEHVEELLELVMFGGDKLMFRENPHSRQWWYCYKAARGES